jgi:site-specific recombinase XerD
MQGVPQLVCRLLYGAGLRVTECLSLRVKDLELSFSSASPMLHLRS